MIDKISPRQSSQTNPGTHRRLDKESCMVIDAMITIPTYMMCLMLHILNNIHRQYNHPNLHDVSYVNLLNNIHHRRNLHDVSHVNLLNNITIPTYMMCLMLIFLIIFIVNITIPTYMTCLMLIFLII